MITIYLQFLNYGVEQWHEKGFFAELYDVTVKLTSCHHYIFLSY